MLTSSKNICLFVSVLFFILPRNRIQHTYIPKEWSVFSDNYSPITFSSKVASSKSLTFLKNTCTFHCLRSRDCRFSQLLFPQWCNHSPTLLSLWNLPAVLPPAPFHPYTHTQPLRTTSAPCSPHSWVGTHDRAALCLCPAWPQLALRGW